MQLTHLGHACLLVEAADTRILIDPGAFSPDLLSARDLGAVIVTHQHADHLDLDRLPALLTDNPGAVLYADPESREVLRDKGIEALSLVAGEGFTVGGFTVTPVGERHAFNHDGVPNVANVGVVLRAEDEPALYHPGDAVDGEPGAVDILATPLNAPWCAVRDTIGFVRRIQPRLVVPIHDALLSPTGRGLYANHVGTYGGAQLLDLAGAGPTAVPA